MRRHRTTYSYSLRHKIQLAPFAAGACDAEGQLHLGGDDTPSLVAGIAGGEGKTLRVQVRRLDKIMSYARLMPLDVSLLKIRVECVEIDAIRGASRLLAEASPLPSSPG